MRKITAAQNRKIHMLASQMGMDDDLLHAFVAGVTKKEHISSLTINEAIRVIDGLAGKREYASGGHMTARQKSYIFFLMKQCGWTDDSGDPALNRLDGFIRKTYGIDNYQWMSVTVASKVIEFLKDLAKRPKEEQAKA